MTSQDYLSSLFSLEGLVAVVTGGSSGIGRAIAGAREDTAARIFCQEFYAELVSVAGVFRIFETIPPELRGKPVQVWLDGDALHCVRIGA